MAKGLITIKKVQFILVIGFKINNMDLDKRLGLMTPNMKEITKWELKKVKALFIGLKALFTQENLEKILLMVKDHINGLMAENLLVNGKIIKCMEKEFFIGLTEWSIGIASNEFPYLSSLKE